MTESIKNRELGMIEIFSIAMSGFLRNFKGIICIVIFLFFPISILQVLIVNKMIDSAESLTSILIMSDGFPVDSMVPVYMDTVMAFFGNQMLQAVVMLFLQPVGIIALSKLMYSFLSEEQPKITVSEAIGEALNCLGKVIITGIPYMIFTFIGMLLFVIPSIYLGIVWTFYVYAIGLSGKKGFDALKYSRSLVKNRFWKTCGFLILLQFLYFGWNSVFGMVYLFSPEGVIIDIIYTTLTYVGGAFYFIAIAILFLNRESIILKKDIFPNKQEIQEV